MPEVVWSRAAERAAFHLPAGIRAELLRTIAYLREHPELGESVTEGRYRGCRRLPIGGPWVLYYRVTGRERNCTLVAIRDARRRPI